MMENAPGRTRLTRRTLLAGLAGAGVSACTSAPPPVPYHDTGRGAATPLPDRVPAAALINPETLWKIDTTFEPGTILIDPHGFLLYFVEARGLARRWPVALGRTGSAFTGEAVIGRKAEWPTWHPTPEMIARDPEKFGAFSDGVPGGPDNPLGARALYLYRNGQDTLFRIHGTNDPASIGKAVSSGCIRMHNTDVVMLYEKVSIGARVKALNAPLRAHPFQEAVSSSAQGSSHRDPARVSPGVRSSLYR